MLHRDNLAALALGCRIAKSELRSALQGPTLETVCTEPHFLRQFKYEACSAPDRPSR